MKRIFKYIVVVLLFVSNAALAQEIIIKEGNYTISGSEALSATLEIVLKPDTWIKSGSDFSAIISEDPYISPTLSNDQNYVFTRVYQAPVASENQINSNTDVLESITYIDGLGRPKQQNAIKASTNKRDIITHITYDHLGRQDKDYLPFESQGTLGVFQNVNINTDINAYYLNKYPADFSGIQNNQLDQVNAFSERKYENSPLNRVWEQAAPGKVWKANNLNDNHEENYNLQDNDHTIKLDWNANKPDEVVYFKVTFDNNLPKLVQNGYYSANRLYVTIIRDENWVPDVENRDLHTTRSYENQKGQVVLKRTFNKIANVIEPHDTYYVYDDFGNLSFVIPPKVTTDNGVQPQELSELCYQYRYDKRNRLVEKKIPGKDWEYIVYNTLDLPVMTQDPNQKANNQWLFTKYDVFDRVVYTGLHQHPGAVSRIALQNAANNTSAYAQYETKRATPLNLGGTGVFYSNSTIPGTVTDVYTINYYDDYRFKDSSWPTLPATTSFGVTIENSNNSNQKATKGLATGSQIKVLDTNHWIRTITGYDHKGRVIYVASKNSYLNTTDIVESQLDFVGKVLTSKTIHTKGNNAPIVSLDTFTYDHTGRLLNQTQKINNQAAESIASNTYDELGQLVTKHVGGTAEESLQDVDYKYNIRGWLKEINNGNVSGTDLFGFRLHYSNPVAGGGIPLYNGNISGVSWKTTYANNVRLYSYKYDDLNRLIDAYETNQNYSLSNISYDKNGNIKKLTRRGALNEVATNFGYMDDLTYNYDYGNKLIKVNDALSKAFGFTSVYNGNSNHYSYDANGNMILDRNKGITGIGYNHLNLPKNITIATNQNNGNITYIYDATGAKLKKIATEGSSVTTTEYAGNYIYKNGTLEFFNQPEGYLEKENDGSFTYIYQYKDHLGNIRLSYADSNKDRNITSSEIREEKNYYPFGMQHKGYNATITGRKHNYGYNGKEEQNELNFNTLDYGARFYDPAVGKWFTPDALAEKYYSTSPYTYALNNPVIYIDPDGNQVEMCCQGLKDFISNAVAGLDRVFGQPLRNAKPHLLDNTPTSTAPSKNITGNYFGDAVYKLAGGETFSRALDGDPKAHFRVISGAIAGMAGARSGFTNSAKKISTKNINLSPFMEGADDFLAVSLQKGNNNTYLGTMTASDIGTILEVDIIVPSGLRKQGALSAVVQKGVDKYNPLTIRGTWKKSFNNGDSVNYNTYIENLKTMSPNEAALNTPTGLAAQKAGYTNPKVETLKNGTISVDFTK